MTPGKNKSFFQPVPDGLEIRLSGRWVQRKLDFIQKYLYAFTTSMKDKPWRAFHYIDLFAGPGKCQIRKTNQVILGSPLLALSTEVPFDRYFFADVNQNVVGALKTRCTVSERKESVHFLVGDANEMVNEVIKYILEVDQSYFPGVWSSLNLAFLDPEGLELKWDTVKILAQVNRMDLIIHYPQMGITREAKNQFAQEPPTRIDDFFGGGEWRTIYRRYRDREAMFLHRELIDLYKQKLSDLGYEKFAGDEPLMKNIKQGNLYRLIFASKHPFGQRLWRQVIKKDFSGQKRLI